MHEIRYVAIGDSFSEGVGDELLFASLFVDPAFLAHKRSQPSWQRRPLREPS